MKCAECFYLFYITVSPLHELPKPPSTPNTLTPLLHTSLQRVCFGNLHVLTNNSWQNPITLAPKERNTVDSVRWQNETCLKQTMCSRVSGAICSRNMFLMCLASVTPCDCNAHCLWNLWFSEACWDSLNRTLLECEAWDSSSSITLFLSRQVWPMWAPRVVRDSGRLVLFSIWSPRALSIEAWIHHDLSDSVHQDRGWDG